MLKQPPLRRCVMAVGLSLALGTLGGAPQALQGQAGRVRTSGADVITRRIQNISPQSGPPGTVVSVSSGLMPAITPVRIGVGGTRMGFEALEELLTSDRGEFATEITVPEWTRWDRNHRFIVFDFYFNPIALSEPFLVTNSDGILRRQGVVIAEGAQCIEMQDVDGEFFTLLGDTSAFRADTRVVVEGTFEEAADCGENLAIRIVTIQAAPHLR